MKKLLLLAYGALLILSSCSKSVDTQKIKKEFIEGLNTIEKYGFDINQTESNKSSSTFLLTVQDANKSAALIMQKLNQIDIPNDDNKKNLATLLNNLKYFKVEANWQKYAKGEPRSIFVYLPGSGKEKAPLKELLKQKVFGAYLTYDKKGQLKLIEIKDINQTITKKGDMLNISYIGAKAVIDKLPNKESNATKLKLLSGKFALNSTIKIVSENNITITSNTQMTFNNGKCDIENQNEYLGNMECSLPTLKLNLPIADQKAIMELANIKISSKATAKAGKINSNGTLDISKLSMLKTDALAPQKITLKKLKLSMSINNIDQKDTQEYYKFIHQPSKDLNKTLNALTNYMNSLFSKGAKMGYSAHLDSIEIEGAKRGESRYLKLSGLTKKGSYTFSDTIDGEDNLTIKNILASKDKNNSQALNINNIQFDSKIAKLYNFMPEFMKFAMKNANRPTQEPLTPKEAKQMAKIGKKILNNGIFMSFSPLLVQKISAQKENIDFNKISLDMNASLDQNSFDPKSGMSPMMLLAFLHANGKVVLDKKDFINITTQIPPRVAAALSMYVKYEGDKAVFELKFNNGHLLINGVPLMQ